MILGIDNKIPDYNSSSNFMWRIFKSQQEKITLNKFNCINHSGINLNFIHTRILCIF